MKGLKDIITSTKPRETSGGSSSNRFDFQKNWAICKILELHKKPQDYLLTLEYHDDIIVFDSSSDPQKISFYQVKTNKANHWTLGKLTTSKKTKEGMTHSHLGNMFLHLLNFTDSVKSLNFVTNNKVKGKLKSDTKTEDTLGFCCSELCDDELNMVLDKLKEEHQLSDLKNFADLTYFKLGELSIDQHSTITKGRLAEFIDEMFPEMKYKIAPLYRAIFDEIKNKSNVETAIEDFDTLKKLKSISRNDFESYLNELKGQNHNKEIALRIESKLADENVDFAFIRKFNENAKLYEVRSMNYKDANLNAIKKDVKKSLDKATSGASTLYETMQLVFAEISSEKYINNTIDEAYLKAIILFSIYE